MQGCPEIIGGDQRITKRSEGIWQVGERSDTPRAKLSKNREAAKMELRSDYSKVGEEGEAIFWQWSNGSCYTIP